MDRVSVSTKTRDFHLDLLNESEGLTPLAIGELDL
jgi:hypothetical protein